MTIGVITIFDVPNYGALLQAYSLCQFLKAQGHEVILFRIPFQQNENKWIYKMKHKFFPLFKWNFIRKYLPSYTENLSTKVDMYIVGSDQVWNYDIVGKSLFNYMLDFAPDNAVRASYASSFGEEKWRFHDIQEKVKNLLSKFETLTVREKSAVSLLKNEFGLHAINVLDPCFLLPLSDKLYPKYNELDKTLVVFKLVPTNSWKEEISMLASKLDVNLVEINPQKRIKKIGYLMGINFKYITIQKWLKSIATSKYFVTDSFHGCVWAIRLQKQFVVVKGIESRMTRLYSLLESLDLTNRIVANMEDAYRKLYFEKIDYNLVQCHLSKLESNSKSILLDILKS